MPLNSLQDSSYAEPLGRARAEKSDVDEMPPRPLTALERAVLDAAFWASVEIVDEGRFEG